MVERASIAEISDSVARGLVSWRLWGDASFINLPLVYPSGSFVTIRLTHAPNGSIRVSDSGFAFREVESFGAGRSFPKTARTVADEHDVEAGRRSIYVDVEPDQVERAIFDVSAATHNVATKIVAGASAVGEANISDVLHQKLDRLFPLSVEYEGKVIGASSTEWEVSAIASFDGRSAVFQAVANYPIAVFKASTAFHDLAALDNPPSLVAVVPNKVEMGKNYALLAQAGHVVEINQADDVFLRSAA